jgi:DNA-binding transcriptional regulator/RsmH inhibitor MraZ
VLPQVLRQSAGLAGDVNVLGMLTYLDVTNIERFEADKKGVGGAVEMSRDKRTALAQKTKALQAQ